MQSTVLRHKPRPVRLLIRLLATEPVPSTHAPIPPPPPPPQPTAKPRSRLYPHPRPVSADSRYQALPSLPPTFGRNQLLTVPDSTRALLESIVRKFDAPIRYAFAYGSGVFEQDGYEGPAREERMLDFVFAVTHPAHWHSINMAQYPGHYALHARALGSGFVARVEEVEPGLWFNAYVQMNGVTIKYGVTTVDNLCSDLLNWRTLYLAGRMHKPLRIIKDDARVRLTQQVNLTSAVRAALLTLPDTFTESQLFERIASISYAGDPRMVLPGENRGKVQNIVRRQRAQFRDLYKRLVAGLPGVQWEGAGMDGGEEVVRQDVSPHARSAHLRKLPAGLLSAVKMAYAGKPEFPPLEADESAYWVRLAGDERLPHVLNQEMARIVRYPATVQSLKGVVSAGLVQSLRYGAAKVGKWWDGRGAGTTGKAS